MKKKENYFTAVVENLCIYGDSMKYHTIAVVCPNQVDEQIDRWINRQIDKHTTDRQINK